MPRVQFSDVTPPERRSIRNIPIPSGGRRKPPVVADVSKPVFAPGEREDVRDFDMPPARSGGKSKKKYIFGSIALAAVVVFIVGMMTVFASATINITPKKQSVDVDMKIIGTNDTSKEGVRYELIKLSKSKTVSVPATGEEAAEIKASGRIVIYNNFSTEPQRLIIRTRFESPEGLIYRIPESIVVPGKTTKNGEVVPGSIEVKVFADEPGEKYNIKKTDFTIPGFKNDANRYKNFYARSVTEMSGGFVGMVKTVVESEKRAALQNIDSEVQTDLQKELETKIPEGLVLLSDSIIYETRELAPKEESSSVVIGKEVTAYALMLSMENLSQKITTEYISESADWSNIKAVVKNFSLLEIINMPENAKNGGDLSLQIKGRVNVWADVDTETVRQKLLGVPKGDAAKLMDEFAGISSITAIVRPIWKQSFPDNPAKIYVQIATSE